MKKMPWKTATKIELSKKQENILTQWEKGTHIPMHLKSRAQIILMANKGCSNNTIEETLGISAGKVKLWRDKYSKNSTEITRVESQTPQKLRATLREVLSDSKRTGAPAKFTNEQVAAIMALSCEDPARLKLPVSHWTPNLLKIESIKLGIVENISIRQIGRFLKRKRFKTKQEPVLVKS